MPAGAYYRTAQVDRLPLVEHRLRRRNQCLYARPERCKSTFCLKICKAMAQALCLWGRCVQREMEVDEQSERSTIPELTTEIVAAYVSSHKLRVQDVPSVIKAVGVELASLGTEAEANVAEKPEPVVPVRRSVRPDHLVCLICGRKQKLLKRHLAVEHELTPNQYRETFGLKSDYPMAAPNYTAQRRELALSIGLGRPKKPARRARKAGAQPKSSRRGRSSATEAKS